ncbi:hypothetical protein [Saprospira grandis]|uniref:hypothetical protein n=1 Tax=Saprospira grandis TaxID=1008 RepID=UPI0022DD2736|nr:hypothetical protein [Saprospira grandis]WBM73597.1 hypothetical protein OP864_11450 [Saprospira grandis]
MSLLISGFFQEHMPFDPIPQIELKGQLDGNWEVDIPQFTDLSQGLDKEQLHFNWEEGSDFVEEMQQALAAGGQREPEEEDYIDKGNATEEQLKRIEQLRKDSPLFNEIYERLAASGRIYTLEYQAEVPPSVGGRFTAYGYYKEGEAGVISFAEDYTDHTIFEEFFHAYQDFYYGGYIDDYGHQGEGDGDRSIREWEAEAKFAVGVMELQKLRAQKDEDKISMEEMYTDVFDCLETFATYNFSFNKEGKAFAYYLTYHSKVDAADFAPIIDEDILLLNNKNTLEKYFEYLKNLEKLYEYGMVSTNSYKGEQRKLKPEAYNSLLTPSSNE